MIHFAKYRQKIKGTDFSLLPLIEIVCDVSCEFCQIDFTVMLDLNLRWLLQNMLLVCA